MNSPATTGSEARTALQGIVAAYGDGETALGRFSFML